MWSLESRRKGCKIETPHQDQANGQRWIGCDGEGLMARRLFSVPAEKISIYLYDHFAFVDGFLFYYRTSKKRRKEKSAYKIFNVVCVAMAAALEVTGPIFTIK